MADCLLLLEDGTGFLVLEDGSGFLLLESCEPGPADVTGGWIEPWPLSGDEDEVVTIVLTLARRRGRLRVG